ncbi:MULTISPECIES: hypothetical protein [unclassified Pseudomonas]|uniref:hypothetical protein n=1 Tax=unclassified Pseudomonas TaxID=196821 RepID=UPI0035BFD7E5
MDISLIPDPRSWAVGYQMLFLLGPAASFLIGMALLVWLAWGREFERAMGALSSSHWLKLQECLWGTTALWSRWVLLGMISGILARPGIHIRRGELDAHEVQCFPADIRRRLFIGELMMIGGLVLTCIAAGIYGLHR